MVNDKVDTTGVPSVAEALEKDTELVDTKVKSVHLVTRGANRKRLHVAKSARAPGSSSMESENEPAFAIDVLKQDTNDGEALQKGIPGLSSDANEAATGIIKLAKSVAEELPPDFFNKVAEMSGFKLQKGKPPADDEEDDDDEEEDETKKTKATKMTKTIEKTLAKLEKEEDIDLLPEDVQKAVRPLWRRNLENEQRIAKMEEQDRERVFVQKAAQYTRIAKGADFVKLMKDAADYLPEDSFKSFIHLLDSHEEMLRKGDLFAEYGSSLEGDASNPLVKWDAQAKELVQKSGGAVTYEQAYTDIVHADPEGYNEVLKHNLARGEQ